MPVSKAQQKAVTKYVKENYDRFGMTMQKGKLDTIKAHVETNGESVNRFINRAIDEALERDTVPSSESTLISPELLKAVQENVTATGESIPVFFERAIKQQMERDKITRKLSGVK
jgi:hypothetical protein